VDKYVIFNQLEGFELNDYELVHVTMFKLLKFLSQINANYKLKNHLIIQLMIIEDLLTFFMKDVNGNKCINTQFMQNKEGR
jgi:hypothetical protein